MGDLRPRHLILLLVTLTMSTRVAAQVFDPQLPPQNQDTTDDFTAPKPEDVTVHDFDGDNHLDIAVANTFFGAVPPGGEVSVHFGSASGTFDVPALYFPVGERTEGITSGFFNADPFADIATANFDALSSSISIMTSDGAGGFVIVDMAIDDAPRYIASGDFDNNGTIDLATAGFDADTISTFSGVGNGGFTFTETLALTDGPEVISVAHVNNDAFLDLVVAEANADWVTILHGDGDGTFTEVFNVPVGETPRYVHAADLNNDGFADFVSTHWTDDDASVFRNDGGTGFTEVATLTVTGGDRPIYANAGDLNGDGDLDVVVSFFDTDVLGIYAGDGNFGFSAPQELAVGNSPYGTALADFNLDGKVDLAVAETNEFNGNLRIFLATPPPGQPPPVISSVTATPLFFDDTETSSLEVIASDPDSGPSPLSYNWIIPAGSVDDPSSPTPLYTPPDVIGTRVFALTVEVFDGADTTTDSVVVTVHDAAAPELLLIDDFNDGDFAGWQAFDEGTAGAPSNWSVDAGEVEQTANIGDGIGDPLDLAKLGTYLRFIGGDSWTDYRVTFDMRNGDNDGFGLMFREHNGDYYRFSWDRERSYRRIVKKVGSTFTLLAEDAVAYSRNVDYTVEITAIGTLIELRIDGALIFSLTDASLTMGSIAFYTWSSQPTFFDDVLVEDLAVGLPNQPPQISSVTANPSSLDEGLTSNLSVAATDPDSGPSGLTYSWTVPLGSVDDSSSPTPLYTAPLVSSTQVVTLTVDVSDGEDTTSATVDITVQDVPNQAPQISSVTASPSPVVEGLTSNLAVTATDPDAGPSPLTYAWTIPLGGVDDSTSATPTYTAPLVTSTQVVTLTVDVSDGASTTSATVDVTVTDVGGGAIVLDEDFEDGNLIGWTVVDAGDQNAPSDWSVQSGEARQNSNISTDFSDPAILEKFGTSLRYNSGQSWTDYRVTFNMRSLDDDAIGLHFREKDGDYYRFSWDRQRSYRRVVKKVGATFTLLAEDNLPYSSSVTYEVEITVQGSLIEVRVDGLLVMSANDTSLSMGTIAPYTWASEGAFFDNIVVEDLSTGSPPNQSPQISSVTANPSSLDEGLTSNLSVAATDPDSGPSGLTYSWTVPLGSVDDSSSPTPLYTAPQVSSTQVVTLTVDVSDGEDTTSATVDITVQDIPNQVPQISSVTANPSSLDEGLTSNLSVAATDPDSGPSGLTYSWTVPLGSVDDSSSPTPLYTAPQVSSTQVVTLTVDVSDGEDTTSATVDITVNDTGGGPVTFQQDAQGFLVMEAENRTSDFPSSGGTFSWTESSSLGGFGGTGAMVALPIDGKWTTNFVGAAPEMRFRFEAAFQGTHYLHVRATPPTSGRNSVHYGLDDTPVNVVHFGVSSTWMWNTLTRTINIPALGEYELTFWARESGLIIDRVVLTTDPDWEPPTNGSGPPESETNS